MRNRDKSFERLEKEIMFWGWFKIAIIIFAVILVGMIVVDVVKLLNS